MSVFASRSAFLSFLSDTLGPLLALSMVIGLFAAADRPAEPGGVGGQFMTARNFQIITVNTATVAVAALGMTLVIIAGGIDLSAGTAMALAATVLAWSLKEDIVVYARHGTNAARLASELENVGRQLARAERPGGADANRDREVAALKSRIASLRERQPIIQDSTAYFARWNAPVAILLAVLAGGFAGMVNGLLISSLRVVPFIVTLGTMTVYLGVAKLIANETTVRPDRATQVPEFLQKLLSTSPDALVFGLPVGVWFTFLLAILVAVVLHWTVLGRHIYAIGSSEATARLCGIHVPRLKILVYTIAGVFIGLAGVYQFSRLSSGNPTSGMGKELQIIAAVVIGGGSLAGGRGSVLGTLAGAALMSVISSGCTHLGVSNSVQDIVLGVIIVVAVTFDQLRQRRVGQRA